MNPTRTQAIKRFLESETYPDLAALYNHDMECQVNVAQDGGERIEGEFKGRMWHAWTDGVQTWKSFRIPYKANTEPEYDDQEIKYDLSKHVEGIGLTGWDWKNKLSRWVAFDFDAISGHSEKHSKKLTDAQLEEVRDTLSNIEWVTIRRSTGGRGLHIYVFLDPVETQTHTEHAALARSVLGKLSALTGFDFNAKVDICGQVMWIWHRKMKNTGGLDLLRAGGILYNIPANWKDHVKVVSGKQRKATPAFVEEDDELARQIKELTGQTTLIPLDEQHKKLVNYLEGTNSWWDQDNHMLVTHTWHLKRAHEALNLKGIFETLSTGKEVPNDINCYLFPLRNGGWSVRRYSLGVQEHPSWDQDGRGWTRCYYNREPDLHSACRTLSGIEDPAGGYVFKDAEGARDAALKIGAGVPDIPTQLKAKRTKLKPHKDGRLVMVIEGEPDDNVSMPGWLYDKGRWSRVFNVQTSSPLESEVGNYDDLIRHLVTESGDDYGWTIRSEGNFWRTEPLTHIQKALEAMNLKSNEVKAIIGSSVMKPWVLVNRPFQPEYPGDRKWNRDSAQFRFSLKRDAENLTYPHWLKILKHCGEGLDDAVQQSVWARANNILTGADYLKIWLASLLQEPTEPLPYLFFYGEQESGKSIFHEAFSLLISRGYVRADASLLNQSAFNGELENAIMAIVEETDLGRKNQVANNRIKDWVTARDLLIHAKGKTPYHIRNTTHWVQCSNNPNACPVFPGDTRITMIHVKPIDRMDKIPKKQLIVKLEQEASDFLTELMNLDIPLSNDRLNVPVLNTAEKLESERMNESPLQTFIRERCYAIPGAMVSIAEFYERFSKYVDPADLGYWTKQRIGRELPPQFPKGRSPSNGSFYYGNISFSENEEPKPLLKAYTDEKNQVFLRPEGTNGHVNKGDSR